VPAGSRFRELSGQFVADLPGARVVFSTRRGGCSGGPFAGLNLGTGTGDAPAAVACNRRLLERMVGAPPLSFVRQVHGATVVRVDEPPAAGAEPPDGQGPPARGEPVADGQVTAARGVALAVLTADCLPIAIAGGGAVAMVHAGWRGLAAGVVSAGVDAVRALGRGGALSAAIGPGAGACCYAVGPEVRAAFAHVPRAVSGERVSLGAVARASLRDAGVDEVLDIGICTICADPQLLFSHRRDRGLTGRQAGVAWLT